jgi:hypothetical protein
VIIDANRAKQTRFDKHQTVIDPPDHLEDEDEDEDEGEDDEL